MVIRWTKSRRLWRRLYSLIYSTLKGIKLGRHAVLMPGAVVSREYGGDIYIGDKSVIHRGAMLLTYGGFIRLGKQCSINPYSVLYGHGGLTIGNGVRIAAHCVVVPANHGFMQDCGPIMHQPMTKRGVRIGNDVWIGAGVRILDGSIIGDGCVVAAGAVVRGTLEPNGIYGGVPVRLIGRRPESDGMTTVVTSFERAHANNAEFIAAS